MAQASSDVIQFKENLRALNFKEATRLANKLRQVWRPEESHLFNDSEMMELALMLGEALFYQGKTAEAQELLKPCSENREQFLVLTSTIEMRFRLQVAECYYSQRNLSQDSLSQAEEVAQELLKSCRPECRKMEEGQVFCFLMRVKHRQGMYDLMGTNAMKAIDAITQSDTQAEHTTEVRWWLAKTLLVYGIAAWRHGESEQAAARLQLSRWLLRDIPDILNRAHVNHSLGVLCHANSKVTEAKRLLDQAKEDYEFLRHELNLSRIYCSLGRYWLSQDPKAAGDHLNLAMTYAEKFGSAMQQAEVLVWQCWRAYNEIEGKGQDYARIDQVINDGKKALKLLERTQGHHIVVDARLVTGYSYLEKRDIAQAEEHFAKALKIAQEHRLHKHAINVFFSLAEIARVRDDLQGARGYYQNAMNVFPDGKFPFSRFLEKKRDNLKAWLDSANPTVFMKTAEAVREDMRRDDRANNMILKDYRLQLDRWLVKQVYEAEGRHVGDTAERLGISRQRVSTILQEINVRNLRPYQKDLESADKKTGRRKVAPRRGK